VLGFTTYQVLKAFHVLAAVTWVGGGIALQVVAIRLVREADPVRMRGFAGDVEWVGSHLFALTSLLVLVLGIWMVILEPAWTFGQPWILFGLAAFAYSFVSGAFYLGPRSGRLKRLFEEQGEGSPEALALMRRLFAVSRVELVILVLVVFDMVLKPGA
jgi:uncharacterized membrane protein